MFSVITQWQADQGILFIAAINGMVTAFNATTGVQIWETQQPSSSWQVDHGIFYSMPTSDLGLSAFNAHSGQQLWYNTDIDQNVMINDGNVYQQNDEKQSIQAFNGQTGKQLWQLNTHGKNLSLSAQNDVILLSDPQETQVEALNGQTGKQLWQHQGTLNGLTESPNQTVISSQQKNETDIIRITDGTILYRISRADIPHEETFVSHENGVAFFLYYAQNGGIQNVMATEIEAIRISTGTTIWTNQTRGVFPLSQNNINSFLFVHGNSLLALRANDGQTLWQYTFDAANN